MSIIRQLIRSLLKPDSEPRLHLRLIPEIAFAVGSRADGAVAYRTDIDKEALSRKYLFDVLPARMPGQKLRFLDIGGRSGELTYLLGATGPLSFDETTRAANQQRFDALYDYFGIDLRPAGPNVLFGDLCDPAFRETYAAQSSSFDILYSNNVLEHFERPWIAAQNMLAMLRTGGLCITIVPFSQRYHEDPGDHYRYTHTGITKLFEAAGPVNVLESGYDIRARRYDWQGSGANADLVPRDKYGAWRETWMTVSVLEKCDAAGQ